MSINNKLFHLFLYEEHTTDPHKRSIKHSFLNKLDEYFDNLNFYKKDCICPICLDNIGKIQFIKTRCNHTFHSKCLQKWKTKQNKCPICRTSLCDCIKCTITDKIIENNNSEVVNIIRYMFNM